MENFGEFVRKLRLESNLGLREFCQINSIDPGNWSKMERGLLPPPEDETTLKQYAKFLKIGPESHEYLSFIEKAKLQRGELPSHILSDERVLASLPLFFRTVRGQIPSESELKCLFELIKTGGVTDV